MTSKIEKTKKYLQLPPAQAVPFTGFDFAKIESREPVAKKMKTFLNRTKEENFFGAGLIIAEWGEGKSDCFERYIKPEATKNGDFAYFVSTSTIVNKLAKAEILFPRAPPESVILAASVLFSLRDELELRKQNLENFPDYSEWEDPLSYIEEVLSKHSEKDKKVIYVFIDEFEEILAQRSEIQKKFISGLKELLNGQLSIIHEGGRFGGCLHFVVACTPYAYNRIRSDIELSQILGALDQRLSSNRIDLPRIEKEEAFDFLMDLLNFCYKHSLPQPLPIKSVGILNGIYRISQRNIRSLVQLLTDLLSSAALNGEMKIVDFNHFLSVMKGKPISVYGCSNQCIDEDLLIKIESTLGSLTRGSEYLKILSLLIGEYRAYSAEEITARTGVVDAAFRINEINQELRKIGIGQSITKFSPIREDISSIELIEKLNPIEKQILLSSRRKLSLTQFREELFQVEFGPNLEILHGMQFPSEKEDLLRLFDLSDEEAEELYWKLVNYFVRDSKSRLFMLSKELADQIFPSPLVLQLDFIQNRQKRMELWRKAMKGFMESNSELRESLIEVINKDPNFKVAQNYNEVQIEYILPSGKLVNIPTKILAFTGRVSPNDIQEILDELKRKKFMLSLLFHVGEIEESAHADLQRSVNIVPINLRPIRAQQLIALALARNERASIEEGVLDERLREIHYDINFSQKINKWLDRCRNEGFLIEDLHRPSGTDEKKLVQALIYHIQTIEENLTTQKVFQESQQLQSLTLFGGGKKPSFAPLDIETPEALINFNKELSQNGFLSAENNRNIILTTPIEKKILNQLTKKKLVTSEITRRFLILAQNEKLLDQVYLPILKAKGLVKIEKEEVSKINIVEREKELQQKIEYYKTRINEKTSDWLSFAHICVSKERKDRIITFDDFDGYLNKLFSKIHIPEIKYSPENFNRALHLIDELLLYFEQTIEPMMTNAYGQGQGLIRKVKEEKEKIESATKSVLQFYNGFSAKKFNLDLLEEFVKIKENHSLFVQASKRNYSKEEIEEGLEYIASLFEPMRKYEGVPRYFYYKRPSDQASFFNYKIFKMEEARRGFSNRIDEPQKTVNEIIKEIEKWRNTGDKSKSKLLTYTVDGELLFSISYHTTLMKHQKGSIKTKELKTLKLQDILEFVTRLNETNTNFDINIERSLSILNDLLAKERAFISMKERLKQLSIKMVKFFDKTGELLTVASAISSELDKIYMDYEKEAKGFTATISKINELKDLNKSAGEKISYLERITRSLEKEQRSIQELFERCELFLKTERENIKRFLDALEERGINTVLLYKPFDEIVSQALTDLKKFLQGEETKYPWNEIIHTLDQLKRKLYKEVKNTLSQKQFNVLLVLAEKSEDQSWFDISVLKKELMTRLNMTNDQVEETIESLLEANLLKRGVSLTL